MLHDNHLVIEENDRDKIIVDGAKITCSYAKETGWKDTPFVYLRIDCDHGFLENNHLCAHEDTCVPELNIPKFNYCFSPYYRNMLELLHAWTSEAPELKNAVYAYENIGYWLPCLQPLLNKWMNVDEKSVIEEYFDIYIEFDYGDIEEKIKEFNAQTIRKAHDMCSEELNKQKNPYIAAEEEIDKQKAMDDNYKAVNESVDEIAKKSDTIKNQLTSDDFYVDSLSLDHVSSQLKMIRDELNNMNTEIKKIHPLAPNDEKQYGEVTKLIGDAYKEVDALYTEVINFKPKERHWLTMDSYLICRGGGVLSFYTNGQEYEAYCNTLLDRIKELTQLISDECQDRLLNNKRSYASYIDVDSDEEGYSYQRTADIMGDYQKMLDDEAEEIAEIKTGVILELFSNAYYQERLKKTLAVVSVVATWAGPPEIVLLLGALQLSSAIKSGALLSGYNAGISIEEKTQNMFPKSIYKFNNLFSTFTAAVDFFTLSSETWTREIKFTIFCDNARELSDWAPASECDYALCGALVLDQWGKVDESKPFQLQVIPRKEYTQSYSEWHSTKSFGLLNHKHKGMKEEVINIGNGKTLGDVTNPEDVQ